MTAPSPAVVRGRADRPACPAESPRLAAVRLPAVRLAFSRLRSLVPVGFGVAVALGLGGAVVTLPARSVRAQAALGPIEVTVRDSTGRSVVGAQVSLTPVLAQPGLAIGRSGVTGDDGRVSLPGLTTGRATLQVRRIGFRAQTREVTLTAFDPAIAVVLGAVPQQLPSVVVRGTQRGPYTGHLADFNRRRDMGFGRFITAAEIDRRNPLRTSDMIRMVPGALVATNGIQSAVRLRNAGCDPLVWIDGAPASAGYLDIDAFPPWTLAGIEVYSGPGTVPVELRGARGQAACGVIALWSRLPDPQPRRSKRPAVTAEMLARLVESATLYTAEQVDEPARLDTAEAFELGYPDELRQGRVGGEALIEFVVDTAGRVETETIGVVAATHPQFARAARVAAGTAKFLPARRQGRPVRQLAQLPLRWEPK